MLNYWIDSMELQAELEPPLELESSNWIGTDNGTLLRTRFENGTKARTGTGKENGKITQT